MFGVIIVVFISINIGYDSLRIGLVALAVAAFLLTLIVVAMKRLHDRDKSGWWLVIFYGIPFLLDSGSYSVVSDYPLYLTGPATLINLWGLIELGFLRGSRGPNRFGEDPIGDVELPPPLPAASSPD
jgi:uncharacterized membrane protein YhaH (DUF805 family)